MPRACLRYVGGLCDVRTTADLSVNSRFGNLGYQICRSEDCPLLQEYQVGIGLEF